MKQTITKPSVDVIHTVDQITIDLNSKSAIVRVEKQVEGEQANSTKVRFKILPFLIDEGYTTQQITGIKLMFKQMIAKAFGIAEAELTDELFPVDIEEPTP